MLLLAIFLGLVFAYSLAARRLERTVLTAPLLFAVAGVVVVLLLPELARDRGDLGFFRRLAEIGLVLLLFTDASRTDLRLLKGTRGLPERLLSLGLLLTIGLGALLAKLIFPALSIWEAGILAAILAPTDAGLGQVIVNSPLVPERIREALSIEAGLNDGISVPFFLFFTAMAAAGLEGGDAHLGRYVLEQLGYGAVIGLAVGFGGGWLLALARRTDWGSMQPLGLVTLPLLAMLATEHLGASMFIAAFVAGIAVQVPFPQAGRHSIEFAEDWGQLLNLSVFFLFGTLSVAAWAHWTWPMALYALSSLTLVRMVPVALALIGSGLSRASVLFIGWFGPRGLASIVLGLVFLEQELHLPGEETIRLVVIATVFLSIFAHGLSAVPGIAVYAAKVKSLAPGAPERSPAPTRKAG
jgi:sodium/hydrogen antiporter